jgi:hypothetical protein
MFKDIISDIFSHHSSLGDRLLALMIVLIMTIASGLLLFLVLLIVDSAALEGKETTTTTIEQLEVVPAHTTTSNILVGKVMVPQIIHHPESYHVHFDIKDTDTSISVSRPFFDSVDVGQRVEVNYGYGRLSGSYRPTAIRAIQ